MVEYEECNRIFIKKENFIDMLMVKKFTGIQVDSSMGAFIIFSEDYGVRTLTKDELEEILKTEIDKSIKLVDGHVVGASGQKIDDAETFKGVLLDIWKE